MERKSGILMPISALPGPYGIGTLGKQAYAFADFLHAAGQSYWQLLPLGPTSYGDSPYSPFSTFAGNPYFIDLELLKEDGLLTEEELEGADWGSDPRRVDYGRIYAARFDILQKACDRGWERDKEAVARFEKENEGWLPDYALFMALKRHFGMKAWTEWEDEDIRRRSSKEVVERYRGQLAGDCRLFTYIQFLFYKQWNALRSYIHALGIRVIGDLPIYVAMDSADVWSGPENFQMDEQYVPREVAGVPPDYFSADGQLWGNPLYDWDKMRQDGFGWWLRRIEGARRLYDVIRIDHFRGFESYWSVPYGAETAREGRWQKGPGMELVGLLRDRFRDTPIIAEDLGFLTPEVHQLLEESGFPGMKVLEFAFDSREPGDYLPHNYGRNCVCYVGTHDNETALQWRDQASAEDIDFARRYLGLNEREGFHWGVIRGGMGSVADLFVAQMQDCLGLGAEARMNTPGTCGGNWEWRMLPGEATEKLAARLRDYTWMYGRL
ncbi:MAG: 4-alpha-glucanotransferase [Oscillospiraceae bacterium]